MKNKNLIKCLLIISFASSAQSQLCQDLTFSPTFYNVLLILGNANFHRRKLLGFYGNSFLLHHIIVQSKPQQIQLLVDSSKSISDAPFLLFSSYLQILFQISKIHKI